RRLDRGQVNLAPDVLKTFAAYDWAGNIEELEAELQCAMALTKPIQLTLEQLPSRIRYTGFSQLPPGGIDLSQYVQGFERSLIETALRQTNYHQSKAAKLLGLKPQTLNTKLKRFAIQSRESP